MKLTLTMIVAAVCLAGCTNAGRAQLVAYGSDCKVTLYSGGKEVQSWKSSGKVLTEADSDGWYFMDSKTKRLIRVSGDVVIEQE